MATTEKYSRTAVTLHWLIALLIGINVVLGLVKIGVLKIIDWPLIDFHKSTGMLLVLGLALVRLGWRFGHKPPPMPVAYRGVMKERWPVWFTGNSMRLCFYCLFRA